MSDPTAGSPLLECVPSLTVTISVQRRFRGEPGFASSHLVLFHRLFQNRTFETRGTGFYGLDAAIEVGKKKCRYGTSPVFSLPSPPFIPLPSFFLLFILPNSFSLPSPSLPVSSFSGSGGGELAAKWILVRFQQKISPLMTETVFMGVCLCICMHCGPHLPFGVPVWYLSDKK